MIKCIVCLQCKLLKASVKCVNVSLTPEAELNQTSVIFWIKQGASIPLDQTVDRDNSNTKLQFPGNAWMMKCEWNVSRLWMKASAKYINVNAYINAFTKEVIVKDMAEWMVLVQLWSITKILFSFTPYFPVYIKGKTKMSKHMCIFIPI